MIKVYLIRHADTLKENLGVYLSDDDSQEMNEKCILSINGEEEAKEYTNKDFVKEIKSLWSSNAVRTIATAKYISNSNNIKLNINEEFKERIIGIKQGNPNYFKEQIENKEYKYDCGESCLDVQNRMLEALKKIIEETKENIAIVTHSQAILFLIMKWANVEVIDNNLREVKITFKDSEIFTGSIKNLETFELEFNDNLDLENIKHL